MEAPYLMQSHFLQTVSPTYGPVTEKLVEYGVARLRTHLGKHKGDLVEPLDSGATLLLGVIMQWLQNEDIIEADLRSRLAHAATRGSTREEVGILSLLRALRDRACFNSVFDFPFTPFCAGEKGPHCRTPG